MKSIISSTVIVALMMGCQAPPTREMTDAQRSAIERDIQQQADEYLAAVAALDVDRAMALFATKDVSFVTDGALLGSYEALRDVARDVFSTRREIQIGWDDVRVNVLSADAAMFHASFHALHVTTAGDTLDYPQGFWTALYQRRNGEWKMVLVHQSARPRSDETD